LPNRTDRMLMAPVSKLSATRGGLCHHPRQLLSVADATAPAESTISPRPGSNLQKCAEDMPEKTAIKRLALTDFRNYVSASLRFDGRHVVLTGDNGSGKTNLLEAVSFLSPGRGIRRASYSDNGAPAAALDELLDHLRVLWLTPSMDGLFTGGASDRRRFLDRLVLSIDPAHGRRATDFERAMKSRNRLLSESRWDSVWLDGIEEQMAGLGVAIALARREMLALLARLVEEGAPETSFPVPALSLAGFMDEDGEGRVAADLEDDYRLALGRERPRDAAAGRTLAGPHKADLLVRHRAKDIEAERCSTGEQKALLVGLVLAHARLAARMTGFAPILLLDEIAAHLDENRRATLFDLVHDIGGQAFMTGTDAAMFGSLGERAEFFRVSNGPVVREDAP
jgi:DNA replication and repair protein RecF